ncbi:MAG: hypothetical protein H5U40_13660, partial [Polyangiaceae bacterium]|nr:hypothetical protein [Polyangiaceae bacterium]
MEEREDEGAVRAFLLDRRGGGRRLGGDALSRWTPQDGQLWVDLDEGSERARAWLREESGLSSAECAPFEGHQMWPRVVVPGPGRLIIFMRLPDPDGET